MSYFMELQEPNFRIISLLPCISKEVTWLSHFNSTGTISMYALTAFGCLQNEVFHTHVIGRLLFPQRNSTWLHAQGPSHIDASLARTCS